MADEKANEEKYLVAMRRVLCPVDGKTCMDAIKVLGRARKGSVILEIATTRSAVEEFDKKYRTPEELHN